MDIQQQNLLPKRTFGTFLHRLVAGPQALVTLSALLILVAGGAVAWRYVRGSHEKSANTNVPTFQKLIIQTAQAQENFALAPTESDSLGVATTTQFRLTSKTDVSCGDVAASLAVVPALAVNVKTVSARECAIVPKEALSAGTLYHVELGATVQATTGASQHLFKWAYQTKETLEVVSTLPRDRATGVPIDTGIEITFNTDRVNDFPAHFSISPDVKGRFEQHRRTWAFIPEERLADATLYTITVSSGVPVKDSSVALEQDVVAKFETATSQTSSNPYFPPFESAFTAVRPSEAPVIDFAYQTPPGDLTATVYAFTSADDLIDRFKAIDALPSWAYNARQTAAISTDGLTKVGDFPLAIEADAATFPTGFDRGYYLISLHIGKQSFQTPLVVSDLGASLTLTKTNAVLWLYDLKTNQPLSNATVKASLDDTRTNSDDRGLAQLKTPSALIEKDGTFSVSRAYFLVTANDGRQTLIPAVPGSGSSSFFMMNRSSYGGISNKTDDYWTYVWTDRTLYRPTDTVNVWGVLKSRDHPQTEHLTFEVWTWDFIDAGGNYLPVASGSADTDGYGAFHASLALTSLRPGFYTLSTKRDGALIANRSFEVQTFTKPAYEIAATTDKLAVIDGDTVRYDIATKFFDGTPAPKVTLHYGSWGQAGDAGTEITTDDHGAASFTRTLNLGDSSRHGPTYDTLMFFPADAAEGDVAATTNVIVYPSSVIFSPTSTLDGDNVTIDLTLTRVDLNEALTAENSSGFGDPRNTSTGETVPNATIKGTVYEIVTDKTKQGTRYDFLEKKVVDVYNYNTHNEKREDFTGKTNGQGEFTRAFTLKKDAYLIDIAAQDEQERSIVRTLYIYKSGVMSGYNQGTIYSLRDANNLNPNGSSTPTTYRIGDSTTIQFLKDGNVVPNEGSFLYLKLQNGVRDVVVSNNAELPVTFGVDDAPNVYYAGVWFHNGQFYTPQYTWDLPNLIFDAQSRKLTVSVTPEQPSYAPGDTAKLAVHVTNANGKPVQAEVNLSGIDEALSVIEWENPPVPLESLYSNVSSGLLQEYVSHGALKMENGAEGGGGGGDNRKDFKDASLFQTVETDGSGNASVSFKLPDNITSWRITAQAVTKNLFAGNVIIALPVTKPIFGVLTMGTDYVLGDQPTVLAYGYGTALTAKDSVRMILTIPDLNINDDRVVDAFAAERFTIPNLTLGVHEVKLTVTQGDHTDTLVRSITVLPSRLTRTTSTYTAVTPGMAFSSPSDARSTLIFSDAGRGRVLTTLESLQWSWGKRLDRSLAAIIARDAIKELDTKTDLANDTIAVADYQQQDGGISLLTYGDSDLRLSAFAASRSDLFNAARLQQYFETKLSAQNTSLEEIGYALFGLANLGEPVLPDLESYLKLDGITDEHRLIAGLAYASLGANDQAYTIASALLTAYGETQKPYIRLTLGSSNDDKIVNTAEFSILAEALKLDERFGFDAYLGQNFPKDTLTNLERALAMRAAIPNLDSLDATFRYRLNGEEKTVTLKERRTYPLSVTADDLKQLSILSVDGPVGVSQYSLVAIDVAAEPQDARLSINRSYSIYGTAKNRPIQMGDIVKITLTPKTKGILDEGLLAIDELPSGLVLIAKPWERGIAFDQDQGYPIEVDGQRVTFYTSGKKSFFYYARVLNPGAFAAEPTILQGERSRDIVTYSGAQTLEIQ